MNELLTPNGFTVIADEPNEVYHDQPLHMVSQTRLTAFSRSPRLYRYGPREETEAMREGTALHCAILEPERFAEDYVVLPELSEWRSKADKRANIETLAKALGCALMESEIDDLTSQRKEEILAYVQGRAEVFAVVSNTFKAQMQAAREAIARHTVARLLMASEGYSELVFRSAVLRAGYAVQCRCDRFLPDFEGVPTIIDLKKIADVTNWRKHMHAFGYYRAPEFYRRTVRAATGYDGPIRFLFVFVELPKADEPAGIIVVENDADTDELAGIEIAQDLSLYAQMLQSGDWSDPWENSIHGYSAPAWKRREVGL